MKENMRLNYIDQLKGITIFLVVVGHFIQYNTVEGTENDFFEFIYAFHMPLFMFISGYIAQKTTKPTVLTNYYPFFFKKVRTLIIPYFAWALIVDKLLFTDIYQLNINDPIELIKDGTGLWFLLYLFFLYIIYSVFLSFTLLLKGSSILIDLFGFFSLLLILYFIKKNQYVNYIDSFILYYGFFFLGVFFSKYKMIQQLILRESIFSFFLIVFLSLVFYYDFNNSSVENKLLKLIVAVSAIVCMYYIVQTISWNPILNQYMSYLGRNSLIIYTTHFKFVFLLSGTLLLPPIGILGIISINAIFAILAIFLSLIIAKIIALCPPLDWLLYGREKIKTQ